MRTHPTFCSRLPSWRRSLFSGIAQEGTACKVNEIHCERVSRRFIAFPYFRFRILTSSETEAQ